MSTKNCTDDFADAINRKTILVLAFLSEGALLAVALIWASLRRLPVKIDLSPTALGIGLFFALLTLGANVLAFEVSRRDPQRWQSLTSFWEEVTKPLVSNLDFSSTLIVALLSGLGEEIFFRGVLDCELSSLLGGWLGCSMSAFIFSVVHFVGVLSRYWKIAALYWLIGIYFSAIHVYSGSLSAVIATHALHNFFTILYLRHKISSKRIFE